MIAELEQEEEEKMKMRLEGIAVTTDNLIAPRPAGAERPERFSAAGSPSSDSIGSSLETLRDQQHVMLMEERYGIREEGIF